MQLVRQHRKTMINLRPDLRIVRLSVLILRVLILSAACPMYRFEHGQFMRGDDSSVIRGAQLKGDDGQLMNGDDQLMAEWSIN